MEMTSCLFRKDVPRPRSVSARCWDARGRKTRPRPVAGSLLEHTLRHSSPTSLPHMHTAQHALKTHTTPYKQISTHTTPPTHHTHSPHTSHRHIPTTPHTTHITQTHTNHTTHHTHHTDTYQPCHRHSPTHIIQTHINTRHNGSTHICTTRSQIHKHPEAYTDAHGHSQSLYRQPLITYAFR